MYFKRLEIFGFKSFADRTVLNFEPGITAIIGPNGCGKSNIFDSIRWVLGEQSVKELRGASMEDVIFNGTDKKAALGFAEVSLTFSNENRALAMDENEVTVTRRLFRSGESEYLLNKKQSRLKDIVELFMGTGIGAEAYSLVQQGRVDLVVSAKPEDRRIILDEASGITKYKAKKREALNKLKDTENNLLRINDIVIEVKRQIASLERQASKARRYKEEFEKLKVYEVQFANHQLEQYTEQSRQIAEAASELKGQEQRLTEELKTLNELIEHENAMLEELEEKINEVNAEDIKLDGQIDIRSRQIGFNEERIANVDQAERRLGEQKEQLTQRCRQQQEKVEEIHQGLAALEKTVEESARTLRERKSTLEVIASVIREAKSVIQEEEERILDITSKQVNIKNKLTDIMKEVQGCLARSRRLEMENAKVSSEKVEVEQKLLEITRNLESASSKMIELRGRIEEKGRSIGELNQQLAGLDSILQDLEKRKLFLISQKDFIEKLSVQYQGIPDPTVDGRLFTSTAPQTHHTGILGKVKEVVSSDPQRDAILRSQFPGQEGPLYEIVCEAKFIELDPQQIMNEISTISAQIAEQSAIRESVASRIDALKQEEAQIEGDIRTEEKTLSVFESQKQDILGESDKLRDELTLVETELVEVRDTLSTLKKAEEEATAYLDSLNQEFRQAQIKIKDRQDAIAAKSVEREETTVLVAQIETELQSLRDKKVSFEENLTIFREGLEQSQAELGRIEAEQAEIGAKRESYRQEIERLQVEAETLKEEKQSLKSVLVDYERQRSEVSQRLGGVQANIAAYAGDIENIRSQVHQLEMNGQQLAFKEKEIKDRLMQAYRIDIDAVNQRAAAPAVTVEVAVPVPVEGALEQGAEMPVAPPAPAVAVVVEPVAIEELPATIERLRKRCESFGSVNLVAIEEFEELKQRFEFLTKQQSDLITARESLHQTITKINRQTRQMFMDTFTKVSEEFRIYFRMLFGGGEAQLVLMDPENVLESGIEIIARPPGKKLQNISLLSGGEKSLTAIALIFGVFKVNPSPFCVLDEIDAALDESNVGRYSYLLKDFSKIAQFIVITHNKKTIANADVMYGITMQETGVSKIVSVKFGNEEKKAEPEVDAVAV